MFDKIEGIFPGLFKTEGTLAQKAVQGGFWVFLSFSFGKVLNFIRIIILARLLLPSDFGLMGLAMLSIGAIEVFTTTGIIQALIQRKECDEEVLNTGWVISILRGFLLFLILFFGAPYIARFFDNSLLTSILRIISITFLFSGFSNIGLILLPRELDFKRKTYFNLATSLLTTIVIITLAFILRTVWALVIGLVIGSVIGLIASYFIHPFRPKIRFNLQISKELLGFGKWNICVGPGIYQNIPGGKMDAHGSCDASLSSLGGNKVNRGNNHNISKCWKTRNVNKIAVCKTYVIGYYHLSSHHKMGHSGGIPCCVTQYLTCCASYFLLDHKNY